VTKVRRLWDVEYVEHVDHFLQVGAVFDGTADRLGYSPGLFLSWPTVDTRLLSILDGQFTRSGQNTLNAQKGFGLGRSSLLDEPVRSVAGPIPFFCLLGAQVLVT
jgi:hypothetical protein